MKRKNKEVDIQMLIIDWIFKKNRKGKKTKFADLVKILSKAPESVLSTKFVKTLVENFYEKERERIL